MYSNDFLFFQKGVDKAIEYDDLIYENWGPFKIRLLYFL